VCPWVVPSRLPPVVPHLRAVRRLREREREKGEKRVRKITHSQFILRIEMWSPKQVMHAAEVHTTSSIPPIHSFSFQVPESSCGCSLSARGIVCANDSCLQRFCASGGDHSTPPCWYQVADSTNYICALCFQGDTFSVMGRLAVKVRDPPLRRSMRTRRRVHPEKPLEPSVLPLRTL
jgi:hypothetical protein